MYNVFLLFVFVFWLSIYGAIWRRREYPPPNFLPNLVMAKSHDNFQSARAKAMTCFLRGTLSQPDVRGQCNMLRRKRYLPTWDHRYNIFNIFQVGASRLMGLNASSHLISPLIRLERLIKWKIHVSLWKLSSFWPNVSSPLINLWSNLQLNNLKKCTAYDLISHSRGAATEVMLVHF